MRALALIALATACGHAPAAGGHAGSSSPYLATYPALRWVPASATYVITARSTTDVVASLRELALVGGLVEDFDLAEPEDKMQRELGFDPLSADSLREIGVDPNGGVAVFSEGLSPIVAVALADPQRTAAFLDERRGQHPVEVAREGGVDVYTYAADREVHLHWAIADRWLFAHVEYTGEHEPELAWYRDLRAAGGAFAASPDVAAAAGTTAPPLVGVVRVPDVRTHLARLGAPRACLDVFAPVGRALIAAGVRGKDADARIAVEVAGAGPALAIAPPPGWAAARANAPIQLEWTADLDRVVPILLACDPEDGRDLADVGVRAGAAFLQQLDLDSLEGRGAGWYAARDTRLLDDALDKVPGLSLGSHKRTVGGVAVVDVSMPMIPSFSYSRSQTSATVAMGAGLIDAIVSGAPAPAGSLAHVEIHPWGLPDEVWDAILHHALHVDAESNRKQAIRRVHRWDEGRIDLTAQPGVLVLTAHGHAHS